MIQRRLFGLRILVILGFLLVVITGSFQVLNRRDLGLTVGHACGAVYVVAVKADGPASKAGVRVNDQLAAVDSIPIVNPAQVRRLIDGRLTSAPVKLSIIRPRETLSVSVVPAKTHYPIFVLLNLLLGTAFIVIGLTVRWSAKPDPTTRSFFVVCATAGVSVSLFSYENLLANPLLNLAYSYLWIATYAIIPVALVIFFIYLTGIDPNRKTIVTLCLIDLLLIASLWTFSTIAHTTDAPKWIELNDFYFRVVFGTVLVLGFLVSSALILRKYLTTQDHAEKNLMRWLLIVTGLGSLPFFLLYKLPMVLGGEQIIPIWGVFGVLLVVPVGWGMAVASFRMLNLEWALSRTIVYTLSVIVSVYLILTIVLIIGSPLRLFDGVSLPTLIVGGVTLLLLGSAGLASPIQKLVDTLYYRDWFNLREAMLLLSDELTKAVSESEIATILTVKLPAILRLEKVTLLIGQLDALSVVCATEMELRVSEEIIDSAACLLSLNQSDLTAQPLTTSAAILAGYNYASLLKLEQGGVQVGALLIGQKTSKAPFGARDNLMLEAIKAPAATALVNLNLVRRLMEQEKRTLAADMAGGIAHEIRNYLFPMLGNAHILDGYITGKEPLSKEDLKPLIEAMLLSMERIQYMVRNLSCLARPPRPEKEHLTMEEVAVESLKLVHNTAGRIKDFVEDNPEAPYKLVRELNESTDLLFADRAQLGQIFINLIINAADAIDEREYGTITVGVKRSMFGGAIGYVVNDGPGIPAGMIPLMFQPFFTTKRLGKGTGLGLPIVKEIVQAHDGWITCTSNESEGTRFEFYIPAYQPPPSA